MNCDYNDVCMVKSDRFEEELVLLNESQQKRADEFLKNHIYRQVVSEWTNNNMSLSNSWKDHNVERYRVSNDVLKTFNGIKAESLQRAKTEEAMKIEKEVLVDFCTTVDFQFCLKCYFVYLLQMTD